ncbi:hypothetical protein BU17DRAFT_79018 [Hysterangium stoloniferum]|nr:hypothetical protein BU17DRAFT_79018 [Hysterangium stoloniferum]
MSGKAATRARLETHPQPSRYQPIVLRRHYERLTSAVEHLPRTAGYGELFDTGTGAGEKGSGMQLFPRLRSPVSLAGETGSKTLHEYDGPPDDSTRQE